MGSNQPSDARVVDPFSPKVKIPLDQLPLAELKRYILGQFEAEKSQYPVGSVPMFALDRGAAASQNQGVGNLSLPVVGTWTSLSSRIRCSVAMSGLRDMLVLAGGTAYQAGGGSASGLSVTLNGVEYTALVHSATPNTTNGLFYGSSASAVPWCFFARIPVAKLERKVYEVELVTRILNGAASGLLYADASNNANLWAMEA